MYMDVHELNREQLDELRWSFYWELQNTDDADYFPDPDSIPDDVLFDHYAGISFVNDDFFCTADK